jgi:hypothetical protein
MAEGIQEKLQDLYSVGWRDERVATWIGDQSREFCGSETVMGPSSQSVYRWRKGKSKPTSDISRELINKLHSTECSNENGN